MRVQLPSSLPFMKEENISGIVYANYIPIIAQWNTPEERVEWYNKNGIDITQVETKSLNQEITEDETETVITNKNR